MASVRVHGAGGASKFDVIDHGCWEVPVATTTVMRSVTDTGAYSRGPAAPNAVKEDSEPRRFSKSTVLLEVY